MEESKQDERAFKPRVSHLYPVISSLAVTGALGVPILSAAVAREPVAPFQGNTISGASLNALYFVVALALTATLMLLLVRRGKMGILRKLMKAAVVVVCFTVTLWYASIIYSLTGLSSDTSLGSGILLAASISLALLLGFSVFGKGKARQLVGVILLSALTGVFLGFNLDLLTVVVLAAALVIYDIVVVFRGPVGALAKKMEGGELPGAMFNYQELTIGMGDMVFYSLLAMSALSIGPFSFLGAVVGIIVGTFLGFKALRRFEMFPGLPFSLVLGIVGMLAAGQLGLLL